MYMFSAFTYIIIVYCQTQFDLLFGVITNCVTYSMLCATCFVHSSINLVNVYEKLDLCDVHSIKQSWKYMEKQIKSLGKPLSLFCVHLALQARFTASTQSDFCGTECLEEHREEANSTDNK